LYFRHVSLLPHYSLKIVRNGFNKPCYA